MEELEYMLPDDYVEENTIDSTPDADFEMDDVEETTEAEEVETTPEKVEAVEPEVNGTEVKASETETPGFKLPYKFNHEEGELTDLVEAQKLVQMGLLYRSKESEFNDLRANKEQYNKIAELAELFGTDANGLYDTLYNQYLESEAEQRGLTPEIIRKERELVAKEQVIKAREASEKAEADKQAMYTRFRDAYPEVDSKSIKPETWALVDKGIDLTTAYTQQVNKEMQEQIKILTQNSKNKSSSPSVGTTRNGTADMTKEDDFLSGLFG